MNALKSLALGFVAGVIAAATVEEAISWLFVHYWTGWDAEPWSLRPMPSLLIPQLVLPWMIGNGITAGLWGALFGAPSVICRKTAYLSSSVASASGALQI